MQPPEGVPARVPATALLGALRNITDSAKVFSVLLERLPEAEREPWRAALRAVAVEIATHEDAR